MTSLRVLDARRTREPLERFGRPYAHFDFTKHRYRLGHIRAPIFLGLPGSSFARASAAYAVNSQGVLVPFGSGVPRITDRGFLVEGAATNLALRSEEFSHSAWNNSANTTVTDNDTTAPDGTLTADRLTAAATSDHRRQNCGALGANTYTVSVYLKAGTSTGSRLALAESTPSFTLIGDVRITWSGGVATISSTPLGTSSIEALANGWYRLRVTATATVGSSIFHSVYPDNLVGTNYCYAWGGQLEATSYASSYIQTTTATVTRAADVPALALGLSEPIGLFVDTELSSLRSGGTFQGLLAISDGTANNRVILSKQTSDKAQVTMQAGGVTQASMASGLAAMSVGASTRIAASFATNDVRGAQAATALTPDTSATFPSGLTTLELGNVGGSAGFAYIRRAAIWNRALTDGELAAVST